MNHTIEARSKIYEDAYRRVRQRITEWAASRQLCRRTGGWSDRFLQYLLVFPDLVHLTIRLLMDRAVPPAVKGRLLIAMAYVIMPLDFIPDVIPCAGLIDDLLVTAVLLNKTFNSGGPDFQNRLLTSWAGNPELFEKVREIVAVLNEIAAQIPRTLLNYIRRRG
ncbi:MAG TPA: DUF1232 domain-containing protein [Candidatus Aminicenantes bacterium]|nr:DUF1232 domain-containing protein [Candidatus Aminicenantes bacterium]